MDWVLSKITIKVSILLFAAVFCTAQESSVGTGSERMRLALWSSVGVSSGSSETGRLPSASSQPGEHSLSQKAREIARLFGVPICHVRSVSDRQLNSCDSHQTQAIDAVTKNQHKTEVLEGRTASSSGSPGCFPRRCRMRTPSRMTSNSRESM